MLKLLHPLLTQGGISRIENGARVSYCSMKKKKCRINFHQTNKHCFWRQFDWALFDCNSSNRQMIEALPLWRNTVRSMWVIPCQAFQFGGSPCADRPRFAQFGNILDHEVNWRRCLHGSVTASDEMTRVCLYVHQYISPVDMWAWQSLKKFYHHWFLIHILLFLVGDNKQGVDVD